MTQVIDPLTGIPLPPDPPEGTTGTPISGLPLAAAITGNEIVPILQNGSTVGALMSNILAAAGGGGGGNVNPISPVGAGSVVFDRVSVTDAATPIVAARPGAPGVGRVALTLQNNGMAAAALGEDDTVTVSGWGLQIGEAITIATTAAVFAITATGATTLIDVLETF